MDLKQELDKRPDLQHLLFRRGWLVSTAKLDDLTGKFPFYDNWQLTQFAGLNFLVHRENDGLHTVETANVKLALIGHCYNPFTMEHREAEQLAYIAEAYGSEAFVDRINELTGVFGLIWVDSKGIHFMTDPSGMQPVYYTARNDDLWLTSHAQILGDVLGLEMSDFARELISYKWYPRVLGAYLPANMSKYESVFLSVPDFIYTYSGDKVCHRRIYPIEDVKTTVTHSEYEAVIKEGARILRGGAELVCRKWKRPSISLTGGIDSNTTFAAFNGNYDQIEAFSYISAEKESPDAEAAEKIANRFQVPFEKYVIPKDDLAIADYDLKKSILDHNCGYVMPTPENEVRKWLWLAQNAHIEVEVKSWVSEIIRASIFHRYGRKTMPKLKPRVFRNIYKIFIGNRMLAHKVDRFAAQFLKEFGYFDLPKGIDYSDLIATENTWGNWGGNNINAMKIVSPMTVIYNNRKFLAALIRVPLADRLSDAHHLDMKKLLNRSHYDMGIHVSNVTETANRARGLNLIFTINNILPF